MGALGVVGEDALGWGMRIVVRGGMRCGGGAAAMWLASAARNVSLRRVMLKNISKLISPELIKVLMEMGHGDEIVFGDSNFPAISRAKQEDHVLVRADGHGIPALLEAILPLFPLDYAVDFSAVLMDYRQRLQQEPTVWAKYRAALAAWPDGTKDCEILPKPDFYARAAKAYAIVATGETEGFANIILRKGVVR